MTHPNSRLDNAFALIEGDILRALDGVGALSINALRDLTDRQHSIDQLQASVRHLVAQGRVRISNHNGIWRPDAPPRLDAGESTRGTRPGQQTAAETIAQLLKSGPLRASEIACQANLPIKTVSGALQALAKKGTVHRISNQHRAPFAYGPAPAPPIVSIQDLPAKLHTLETLERAMDTRIKTILRAIREDLARIGGVPA